MASYLPKKFIVLDTVMEVLRAARIMREYSTLFVRDLAYMSLII